MRWTPQKIRELIDLKKAGRPVAEIARELGCSGSAIQGQWTRIKGDPEKHYNNALRYEGTPGRMKSAPALVIMPREYTLIELDVGMCRWPSATKPYTYCGAPTGGHQSYCPHHRFKSRCG